MKIRRKVPNLDVRRFRHLWGCPLTKNRTSWCFALCTPVDGMGTCGRIAPHSLSGRTIDALRKYETLQRQRQGQGAA